jgi:glycine reductase
MFGRGAELSRYGSMRNVSIDPIASDGAEERDFENAVKLAGLRTSVYLAQAAVGNIIDLREIYELNLSTRQKSKLPRVAYGYLMYTSQHDYQGVPDPIFYGNQVSEILPTVIHPNEVLDGAVVNAHTVRAQETYSIQNHAIIKELYKRHGKELEFAGVVVFAAGMEPIKRQMIAMMTANLVSNVLGADGVVLTKVHGGMPHVDLAFAAEACEESGVKSTIFIQSLHSGSSKTEQALFSSDRLDAIVNFGQTLERINLGKAENILGGTTETKIYHPDYIQKAADERIEIEGFLLAGVYDHMGGSRTMAVDY